MKLIDLMSYVYEKQNVIITDMAIMEENNVNFYNSDYSYIGTGHYSGIAKNVPIYHANREIEAIMVKDKDLIVILE